MSERIEKLIKAVFGKWQKDNRLAGSEHPDEEAMSCFLEAKLSQEENEHILEHLADCGDCAERVALQLKLDKVPATEMPDELLARAKSLVAPEGKPLILEVILKLKDDILEVLNTTGDILVGQEFMPAPVLRSRRIKDFKDEVTVLKDFADLRVELKIENKSAKAFSVAVTIKQKQTQRVLKDLRVTLIRDDLELESYISDSGVVIFEHVLAGKYTVRISSVEKTLASVLLDVRV